MATIRLIVYPLTAFLLLTVALLTLARRETSGAWIAFASNRGGESAVYMMTGDGRLLHKITPDHVCGTQPDWSPDARWVAFRDNCAAVRDLLVIHPGGAVPQVVNTGQQISRGAQWSPDGNQLLVTSNASDLYIVEDDSDRLLAQDYDLPAWSPDGEWIYARPHLDSAYGLDRVHVATGRVERLLTADAWFTNPGWSPDGMHFVIGMEGDEGDELFLMTPDGNIVRQISDNIRPSRVFEPHWSPDGEWIAFLAGNLPPIAMHVYRIRPDGSDLQRLSEKAGLQFNMQWSPDSMWLLFSADFDDASNIYRLRADGSVIQNLTPEPGNDFWPKYAPVSGRDWHPAPMILAVLVILVVSMPLLRQHKGMKIAAFS